MRERRPTAGCQRVRLRLPPGSAFCEAQERRVGGIASPTGIPDRDGLFLLLLAEETP